MSVTKMVITNRKNEIEGEFYYEATCNYCTEPFKARRSNVKFCSKHCSFRWHYENNKKKKLASNPQKKNHKTVGSNTKG